MNCPSRTDETMGHDGWNQSPPSLAADLTTRQDLNGIANSRSQRDSTRIPDALGNVHEAAAGLDPDQNPPLGPTGSTTAVPSSSKNPALVAVKHEQMRSHAGSPSNPGSDEKKKKMKKGFTNVVRRIGKILTKFSKFIGPGFMVSVAYIDPGNYSTDIAAGSRYRFKLLFIILMSNLFAIFLQSLCVKLGTVTGMNLAEHCKANLPKWLNIVLYIFAESAIIATDIAEVSGVFSAPYQIFMVDDKTSSGHRFCHRIEPTP
jgi:metal iron transporter